ncbi:MAG TPA: Ig-like domain-containing protein [Chryseolinea sp.]
MKSFILTQGLTLLCLVLLSCSEDGIDQDTVPKKFEQVQLRPDEIYTYNSGSPLGTRLDPLLNDSIKIEVNISYSAPAHGIISFIENEGWFYKPNDNFFGEDNFTYTACHGNECQTASIKLHVERPLDGSNCTYAVTGESVTTSKDQPIEIRIFNNDVICPFAGMSINSPEKGTFNSYSYAGGYKNTVYVYFPPKGFVGQDRFVYKVFTDTGSLEAICTINVNP